MVSDDELQRSILAAMKNIAAHNVQVEAFQGAVTLSGSVGSSSENDKAVAAAWTAFGVTNVATLLEIKP